MTPLPPFWAYFLLQTAAMVHPGNHEFWPDPASKDTISLKAAICVATHGSNGLV